MRTESDSVSTPGVGNLAGAIGTASRVRAVLEGSRSFALSDGGSVEPSLSLALSHDGGDAETGTGVEIEELPERERNRIDSLLDEDRRQVEAISHVDNHLAQVQGCRNDFEQLKDLANTYKLKLEEIPSYDEWHETAERLLAAGKAIAGDRKTYGPCLDHHPGAWKDVHAGIRELAAALGRDTTSLHHRQPELYLEPITRPLPDSQQARDADASYRRLRDQWHEHVALAEDTEAHSYDLQDHAPLLDAMRELRNLPDLATNARQALDTLFHDYTHLHWDRQHIHACLDEAERALEEYRRFKDTVQKLSPLQVGLSRDAEGGSAQPLLER